LEEGGEEGGGGVEDGLVGGQDWVGLGGTWGEGRTGSRSVGWARRRGGLGDIEEGYRDIPSSC